LPNAEARLNQELACFYGDPGVATSLGAVYKALGGDTGITVKASEFLI